MTPLMDTWPDDDEMAEPCGCGHTLGQHEYGDDYAPCDVCSCRLFHPPIPVTVRLEGE